MSTRWLSLVLAVAWLGLSVPAWAATDINLTQSDGTKTALGGTGDSAHVTITGGAGAGGSGCNPTAAFPTYAEGVPNYLSCTLEGRARVAVDEFNVLLAYEDQDNQLAMVSGGKVRQDIVVGGPAVAATNATSATFVLPVGKKTFQSVLTCTGTCTQIHNIYGSAVNSAVVATSKLLCTLTLSDTTNATASCDVDTAWSHYFDVTSGTGGGTPLSTLYAMY